MSKEKEFKKKQECVSQESCDCKNDMPESKQSEDCVGAGEKEEQSAAKDLTIEEQLIQVQDKYVRLVAEFDNFRKRTARERLDLIMTASQDTIEGILPVLDDFERAIIASESATEVDALREGTKLIHQKLADYLDTKGLKPIDAEAGSDFDTDLHDAVTKFPAPEESLKNKILDTVQKGYRLHEKVIRYAKVVVGE
ncbi:MAG: nucleotide exchange factor GrpE [Bacteroidales bacterium]